MKCLITSKLSYIKTQLIKKFSIRIYSKNESLVNYEKGDETCIEKQGEKSGVGAYRCFIFYLNANPLILRYEKLILELGDERSNK